MYQKAKRILFNCIGIVAAIVCLSQMTACSRKPVKYFQNSFDTSKYTTLTPKEITIQKNDILSIVVYSDNAEASTIYNQPMAPVSSSGSSGSQTTGYLVNDQGDIQFQGLGTLRVEGLTKIQLSSLLYDKLKEKLNNPYFSIRFMNYRILVQGEVNHSGEFQIPNERITILEAIALAGDVTIYAKRDDVLLIRELNGKRDIVRLDITDPNIFYSPYYYLKQNDLVVVQPTKRKPSATRQENIQNLGIAASLLSMAILIYSLFK
ncbi:MAG: polysaccharide biosynthesis/export family protein [Chitinophagaceae bacterium]